jgi:hypothetical protein
MICFEEGSGISADRGCVAASALDRQRQQTAMNYQKRATRQRFEIPRRSFSARPCGPSGGLGKTKGER